MSLNEEENVWSKEEPSEYEYVEAGDQSEDKNDAEGGFHGAGWKSEECVAVTLEADGFHKIEFVVAEELLGALLEKEFFWKCENEEREPGKNSKCW